MEKRKRLAPKWVFVTELNKNTEVKFILQTKSAPTDEKSAINAVNLCVYGVFNWVILNAISESENTMIESTCLLIILSFRDFRMN